MKTTIILSLSFLLITTSVYAQRDNIDVRRMRGLVEALPSINDNQAQCESSNTKTMSAADREFSTCIERMINNFKTKKISSPDVVPRMIDNKELGIYVERVNDGAKYQVNEDHMIYAASLAKTAGMVASFQFEDDVIKGKIKLDKNNPDHKTMFWDASRNDWMSPLALNKDFIDTINMSCSAEHAANAAATKVISTLGAKYIDDTMEKLGLYDRNNGGGMWVARGYGDVPANKRNSSDPVAGLSHGATPFMAGKMMSMIAHSTLISKAASKKMIEMLTEDKGEWGKIGLYWASQQDDDNFTNYYRHWAGVVEWTKIGVKSGKVVAEPNNFVLSIMCYWPKGDVDCHEIISALKYGIKRNCMK